MTISPSFANPCKNLVKTSPEIMRNTDYFLSSHFQYILEFLYSFESDKIKEWFRYYIDEKLSNIIKNIRIFIQILSNEMLNKAPIFPVIMN